MSNTNYALEINADLQRIIETQDVAKRHEALRSYFTEGIVSDLYQSMDLIRSTKLSPEHYAKIYELVAKKLFVSLLAAYNFMIQNQFPEQPIIDVEIDQIDFPTPPQINS